MGKDSEISWTHHTHNRWWGCSKISPACANCYADAQAHRWDHQCFGDNPRRLFGPKHMNEPAAWAAAARKAGVRARVFCMSMGDVLEDRPELESPRASLWPLVQATADALDWLFLTKRPENALRMVPSAIFPISWWGVTAEDQERLEARALHLLQLPARVRFVSAEPLLGRLDIAQVADHLEWVIVGGESGAHARRFDLEHARDLCDQCRRAGIAFYFKQAGRKPGFGLKAGLGFTPADYLDREGRDPIEWPADLRVQEFPTAAACP